MAPNLLTKTAVMKKRIKYLLVAFLSFLSIYTFSQKVEVRGGLNLSTQYSKVGPTEQSDEFNYDYLSGWHFGLTYEQELSKVLGLESGIYFTHKGFKTDSYNLTKTLEYKAQYVEMPLVIKLYQPVSKSVKLYIGAGPYIGIGISGKLSYKETDPLTGAIHSEEEFDIKWGDGKEDSSRITDLGASVGAGVLINNVELSFTYRHTLNNLSPYYHDNKLANRVLMFSLGYCFQL